MNKEEIAAYKKAYYQSNKDKYAKRHKEYYKANKEKLCAYAKAWQHDNLEKRSAYMKVYQQANKEKVSANTKSYQQANKEKVYVYKKAYRQANKEKLAENLKAKRQARPEIYKIYNHKYRALKRQSGGTLSKGITEKLMVLQRGKCAVCKVSVKDKHHLDHIMPLALGGTNEDSNIQILCPSCNCSKGAKHPQDFMNSRGFLL